ncbi:MAG: outer membrane protein transport protein [Polyangiales bacterium]
MRSPLTFEPGRARLSLVVLGAALLGVALGVPVTAHATPADLLGFGARNIALGGAVAADVQDGGANYYNPAGLVGSPGLRLSLSYASLSSDLHINDVNSHVERISGLNLGIVAPAAIGSVRLAFGLAVHLPDQRINRTRSSLPSRPFWTLYDSRPHKVYLATNLALQLVPWLNVGVGVTFQSASTMELDIVGDINFLRTSQTRLTHQLQGDLLSSRAFQAGAQVRPLDWLSIGLTWRGALALRDQLTARVEGGLTGLGPAFPVSFELVSRSVGAYIPQQLVVGVAARPIEALRVSLDVSWVDWSKHPSLISTEELLLNVELPPGIMLDIPSMIGGTTPVPMNLRDIVVPRVGVEWDAHRTDAFVLHTRAGYVFERSPFPAQRGRTNFVDSNRHSLALGVGATFVSPGRRFPGDLNLDAYFLYAQVSERAHEKLSLVDPVGDYTAGGRQYGFGLQVELAFH